MVGMLQVIQGPDQGQAFLFGKHIIPVGRAAELLGVTGIRLNDSHVSRLHCRIDWQGEKVLISDAGSGSGTWVNGERLAAPRELLPGDLLVLGETHLEFRWSDKDLKPTVAWQPAESDES
jgi:pSer/pThr/pTyr-binding forkhead associated (FHA) protein